MLDAVLCFSALIVLCLVATAPGTPDRAVVRKIILGALVTGAMVTFAAG